MRRSRTSLRARGVLVAITSGLVTVGGIGSAPLAHAEAFTPWTGTVKVEWSIVNDGCDGCISDSEIDAGSMTYTLVDGRETLTPGHGLYTSRATGSGSIRWEAVTEEGTDWCTQTWAATSADGPQIGLEQNQPEVSVPYMWVTPSSTGNDCEWRSGDVTVGFVSGVDWTQAIPDSDVSPTRWTGSSTQSGTDPDGEVNGEMRSYTYTVSVDLTRESRLPTAIVARSLASGYCLPTRCVATKIAVAGAIQPGLPVPLTVRLRSQKAGRWVVDDKLRVTAKNDGTFSTSLGRTRGTPCRVDVRFAGNTSHAPSSWNKTFSC